MAFTLFWFKFHIFVFFIGFLVAYLLVFWLTGRVSSSVFLVVSELVLGDMVGFSVVGLKVGDLDEKLAGATVFRDIQVYSTGPCFVLP